MKEPGWEALTAARLRLLAAADETEQAPPWVETALRQSYRRHYGARRARWPWIAAWGAVAASVLAVLAITALPRRDSKSPAPEHPPAAPPARLEAAPQPSLPAPRRPARARRYNVEAPAVPAPARREIATDFLPLIYGETLTAEETQQVVRVRLPRAALASFGLPVSEDRTAERVQADVVLDGVGMARAIRFVRENPVRE
jgi:hypothetical protein